MINKKEKIKRKLSNKKNKIFILEVKVSINKKAGVLKNDIEKIAKKYLMEKKKEIKE